MSKTRAVWFAPFPALAVVCLFSAAGQSPEGAHRQPVHLHVTVSRSIAKPVSGRLLVFLKQGAGDKEIDFNAFHPQAAWIAAREVQDINPGDTVDIDADEVAFPRPFSEMPAGDYEAQAVLDVDHTYNYSGRAPQDWVSGVTPFPHWTPGADSAPPLTLDQHPAENPHWTEMQAKMMAKVRPGAEVEESFSSPLLSQFWGHPVQIRAWVILPPGYDQDKNARYPTVYWTHGFGGSLKYALMEGLEIHDRMETGKLPPMIWVMLDESIPQGTHEFANSVNNGPWGTTLTTEFLPYLERKYRMDSRPNDRFLNGHSSGGWATLQLQINYPKIFGGTWSTSPDPSDFHDFTGVNLYAANANLYQRPDGTPTPLIRDSGKVVATFEQFARTEAVLGPYGGQISSFDWVFSPKDKSGAPEPMFDRTTGAVNARVVEYWRDHYDLAHIVEATWAKRGHELRGRIHLIVGTADTFYLDGAAHQFESVLKRLDAGAKFTYLEGRTHFDLYKTGNDQSGLMYQIGSEMYAVARPGVDWKKQAPASGAASAPAQ